MIIFGTRTKFLNGSTAVTNCNHCGSSQTVHLSFALKYFHIFWIPMFPLSKTGVSQCSHCKQVLYANEMPDGLKAVYQEENKKVKTPWGYRFGLILIALFFAFVIASIVFGGVNKQDIKTAQVNDIYQIKEGARNYALYKVVKVEGEMITVVKNTEVARKSSELKKLMKDASDQYTLSETRFSKKELEAKADNRSLIEVVRANEQ